MAGAAAHPRTGKLLPPLRRRVPAPIASPSRLAVVAVVVGLVCACGSPTPGDAGTEALEVWTHGGTEAELAVLTEQVAAWEAATDVRVDLEVVPEGEYTDRLQAATAADQLPDVVDVDGPLVASFAHQGVLAPLDGLLPDDVVADALPSLVTQGTWDGRLYALGAFESGLSLFADAPKLAAAGVRIPTGPQDAWSGEELSAALDALAGLDDDGLVLDTKRSYGVGEWLTYGFSPLLGSAGAGLVDPGTGLARGSLDSPDAVRALALLQRWQQRVDPDDAGTAFVERRAPLSWVGHWEYARYAEALGSDLVLLPLPDLGRGTRVTTGSWAWAVAAGSQRPDDAASLVAHLLSPESVVQTTDANGAVPGRSSVLETAPDYQPGGPRSLYAEQLLASCGDASPSGCVATQRPVTPAYPVITAAFAQAVDDVLRGADPATALTTAATTIDADREANGGYAPIEP